MLRKPFLMILFFLLIIVAADPIHSMAAADKSTILVLSFDGMKNDYVHEHKKALPHLYKLMKQGTEAKNITAVSPSLTAASHSSIATGAKPEKTGLVSNEFKNKNKKLTETENAFWSRLGVPAIWNEARKHGKVTATIAFPGSNPEVTKQDANYAIYYGDTWSPNSLDQLSFHTAKGWKNAPESSRPLKEATFRLKLAGAKNRTIYVLAAAGNHHTYDTFYFSADKTVDQKDPKAGTNQWGSFPIQVKNNLMAGFWFKIKQAGSSFSHATLYRTAVTSANIEGPHGFSKTIQNHFGFFPVAEDSAALKKGWITRREYEDISTRFVNWVEDVSFFIKNRYHPDLLMFYEPQIDHEEHAFLLTDPRQPGYSKQKAKQYANYIDWSYKLADQTVGKTLKAIDRNDKLFVVSDHGMEPMHTSLSPNYELEKNGLLAFKKNGEIDLSKTKAYAVASGTMAHVYINLKGREKGGIVSKRDYQNVQNQVARIFETIRDPRVLASKSILAKYYLSDWWNGVKNGHSSLSATEETATELYNMLKIKPARPYQSVIKAQSKKSEWSHQPHAGDITLVAARGYMMDSNSKSSFHSPSELGNHGGNPERSNLRPVLFVYGKGIPNQRITRRISLIDVAPTIYKMMGIPVPDFVDGQAIKELTR
ncbi:alkaline phosphatase family protein [Heyndrickxia acidiproducens]|uniref:alkaline phosphatase family protein n=1 Tax=Heyndrickxia acidiproducens TaxID=1121084 RepID=UPI000374A83D|nr:alkaline phosphatase family protein [Heyndrickxia acidiproducens]